MASNSARKSAREGYECRPVPNISFVARNTSSARSRVSIARPYGCEENHVASLIKKILAVKERSSLKSDPVKWELSTATRGAVLWPEFHHRRVLWLSPNPPFPRHIAGIDMVTLSPCLRLALHRQGHEGQGQSKPERRLPPNHLAWFANLQSFALSSYVFSSYCLFYA